MLAESGCRYFQGSFDDLEADLERRRTEGQEKYARTLNVLLERQQHHDTVGRRRRRKKNLGRLHEERRAPSKAQLHGKKGYAQVSQGKAAKLRGARMAAVEQWAHAARRALHVSLPLESLTVELPEADGQAVIELDRVGITIAGRRLFEDVGLRIGRDRLGVTGPNGAGKTTLLRVMAGQRRAIKGTVTVQPSRIGCIAQGGCDWLLEDSLAWRLTLTAELDGAEALAQLLVAHRFPLALAQRPMATLSPGERVRAALICLFHRVPAVELLMVDEPTSSLDLEGLSALTASLSAWPGGLIVATHDQDLLQSIGIEQTLELDGQGGHCVTLTPHE